MYDKHPFVPLSIVMNFPGARRDATSFEQPLFQLLNAINI